MPPMGSTSRPNQRHKPKVQPDSRTKFDVWLESHLSEGESVSFFFKDDPISVYATEGGIKRTRFRSGQILTVDRYMVFLDFGTELGQFWVAKEQIISCY